MMLPLFVRLDCRFLIAYGGHHGTTEVHNKPAFLRLRGTVVYRVYGQTYPVRTVLPASASSFSRRSAILEKPDTSKRPTAASSNVCIGPLGIRGSSASCIWSAFVRKASAGDETGWSYHPRADHSTVHRHPDLRAPHGKAKQALLTYTPPSSVGGNIQPFV